MINTLKMNGVFLCGTLKKVRNTHILYELAIAANVWNRNLEDYNF